MNWNIWFKQMFVSVLVLSMIGFGFNIMSISKFWGYFNILVGSMTVYFLAEYYFKSQEDYKDNEVKQ